METLSLNLAAKDSDASRRVDAADVAACLSAVRELLFDDHHVPCQRARAARADAAEAQARGDELRARSRRTWMTWR